MNPVTTVMTTKNLQNTSSSGNKATTATMDHPVPLEDLGSATSAGLVADRDQADPNVEATQASSVQVLAERGEVGSGFGPVASTSTRSPVAVTPITDQPASLA
jgi:hypothetical protein